MSQQGPIVVATDPQSSALGPALAGVDAFPLIETGWPDAADAVARLQPAAVIAIDAAAHADVLVTLGGASVGDHDLVQSTLVAAGMELDFWRIAMRPGKPLMVGSLGAMQVLGLPGNPVSTLVCGLLFMEPLLSALARQPQPNRATTALTTLALPANDQRQDHLRARLSRDSEGQLWVESFGKQDSSMMKIFAHSDCLIVRRPHAPELPAGAPCPILLLRPFRDG